MNLPWACDDFHRQYNFVLRMLHILLSLVDIVPFTFLSFWLIFYVTWVE